MDLTETLDMEKVWTLFAEDKKKCFVAVLLSPAVRVCLGDKFGLGRGEDCGTKIAAILRVLGADAVVDTAICDDVVTLAQAKQVTEGTEKTPVFATNCWAWRGYAAEKHAALLNGGVASSMEIAARLVKKQYSESYPAKEVFVVAILPCEKKREVNGADVVLTMDELIALLQSTEVNLRLVGKVGLDTPLGVASGAAYLQAASGGVAEALARCVNEDKSPFAMQKLLYSGLYHGEFPRVADIEMNGRTWRFAVAISMEQAEEIIARSEQGEAFDFVEVVGRLGGPIGDVRGVEDAEGTLKLRGLGLRYLDKKLAARSADLCAAATPLLKEWEKLLREEKAESAPENLALPEAVEVVAEREPVEEVVATPVEETEVVAVEPVVEEGLPVVVEPIAKVTEPVIASSANAGKKGKKGAAELDDVIDRWEELDDKTRAMYYRRFSTRERKRLARKKRNK